MNPSFSQPLQERIEAYLDAVEDRLRSAGEPRARRRAIVDDLETQIADSLPDHAGIEEVDALLARLDPPAAYDEPNRAPPAAVGRASGPSRFNRNARNGLIGLVVSALLLLVSVGYLIPAATTPQRVVEYNSHTNQTSSFFEPPNYLWEFAYRGAVIVAAVTLVAATVSGWLAARAIGRSGGSEWGLAWAAVEALLLPLIAAGWAGFGAAFLIMVAIYDTSNLSDTGRAMVGLIGSVLSLILWGGLIFLFIRTARGSQSRAPVLRTPDFAT